MILGNKNTYCLGFGMVLIGAGCLLYAVEKVKTLDKNYRELSDEFYGYDGNDIQVISEYQKQLKLCKRQSFKSKFMFYGFSGLMIILGFIMMI